MRFEEGSAGSMAVPWGDLAGAIVLVQNLGAARRHASYSFIARHDPLVPFELMGFTADDQGGMVSLTWSTEREVDLSGWIVHRSRDPHSGFVPITSFMVPAAGGAEPASYSFLDTEVRFDRKYYYLLQGITRDGFTEFTHATAVRLSPAPAGPDRP